MMPASTYAQMKSGIPKDHVNFWNSVSLGELYSLYKALHASPVKVLELTEEPILDNPMQQHVFNFLCDFIGNMKLGPSCALSWEVPCAYQGKFV